jgi:hypothetical protein
VLPGTTAIVILGDALTGRVSPLLLVVSACTAGLGLAGLAYEIRLHRRGGGASSVGTTSPSEHRNDERAPLDCS